MMRRLGAVVMLGAGGESPQQKIVADSQRAASIDLIVQLQLLGISPIILSAPDLSWWPDAIQIWLAPDPTDRPFHFGEYLAETVLANQLHDMLYFGGASAPLLDLPMLRILLDLIRRSESAQLVICNNLHSSDWVAIRGVQETLNIIKSAERDNSLAWMLRESARFDVRVLSNIRQAATFDLDTPADIAMLRQHPDCGAYLRQAAQNPLLDAIPVESVLDILRRTGSHVTLIGRVAPKAWEALNQATQCWIRVFSEERGMVASEREKRGEVQSLIGKLIEAEGFAAFFRHLGDMTEAAIIDSRVLMAHFKRQPSDADRFASDLFMVDVIEDEWLREFTAAAAAAPIPIILGGHSVVAGGLYVMSEILNLRKDTAH